MKSLHLMIMGFCITSSFTFALYLFLNSSGFKKHIFPEDFIPHESAEVYKQINDMLIISNFLTFFIYILILLSENGKIY